MDHDSFHDQYDDHPVEEHDYSHTLEDEDSPGYETEQHHNAIGHGSPDSGEVDEDGHYDPDVRGDAQTLNFDPACDGLDYESPSPSYPYTEDQQPPDSEITPENLGGNGEEHGGPWKSRHVSPVSGAELDHDSSIIAKYMKSKDPDWDNLPQRTEPLNLLELPVDVLRLIVKEITHTNDLTSLALTNSTLHNLTIPHIYSRFDIVWPDAHSTTTEIKSVDALTYGLSTLCLGSRFARTTQRLYNSAKLCPGPLAKFTANNYAQYTRKFSLGNGPNDWVSEYLINKESGKMLGTLVALAVSKMVKLETFIWDMPTGVLSDIFMALASLPDAAESGRCQLKRVWVRWHDNSDTGSPSSSATSSGTAAMPTAVVPAGSTLTPIGISLPSTAAHPAPKPTIPYAETHVEYPTFSVLPPLKSLTVLDIDELAYLDEMAVLIERSIDTIQELRVGISSKAAHHDFVQTWDGPDLEQVDHKARWPGESVIGERRLGGILGVLVGRVYDIRRKSSRSKSGPAPVSVSTFQGETTGLQAPSTSSAMSPVAAFVDQVAVSEITSGSGESSIPTKLQTNMLLGHTPKKMEPLATSEPSKPERIRLDGKLKLSSLELERVPLSMQVCSKAFDWTILTRLTILDCAQHENLWKLLKKVFQPQTQVSGYGISPTASRPLPNAPLQYTLGLKYIHTDVTSPSLISFLRETLAPNSLETLFLQDRRRPSSSAGSGTPIVTIETIFKGAIKRHRASLRRLLLDSSAKTPSGPNNESTRWRSWCLPTEMLQYITSGRMPNLRELAVSIEYRDWHMFLQRLPNVPQLRSLHIPFLADYVSTSPEPKELVMQMADIITLRPEIQLCYVGIASKCFEILENRSSEVSASSGNGGQGIMGNGNGYGQVSVVVEDATDDDDTEDDDNDDDDSQDEGTPTSPAELDEGHSEHSYDDSDGDSFVEAPAQTRLRLREILFYDDKVAIFKARHGRL